MKVEYFNSEEASRILGVNVSTIKRWTEEGKLNCTKTAGGHRKFLLSHLVQFLENNQTKVTKAQIFPMEKPDDLEISKSIFKQDYIELIRQFQQYALTANRQQLVKILKGLYISQIPLHGIYDNLITPVLWNIGKMWEEKLISVNEEHFATQAIRDGIIRLQGQVHIDQTPKGIVICATLPGEWHDLSIKMVDHILELRGYKVIFSGQNTPVENFAQIFELYLPRRFYISSTFIENKEHSQEQFNILANLCQKYGVELIVGGRGFLTISSAHPAVTCEMSTFKEISEY